MGQRIDSGRFLYCGYILDAYTTMVNLKQYHFSFYINSPQQIKTVEHGLYIVFRLIFILLLDIPKRLNFFVEVYLY